MAAAAEPPHRPGPEPPQPPLTIAGGVDVDLEVEPLRIKLRFRMSTQAMMIAGVAAGTLGYVYYNNDKLKPILDNALSYVFGAFGSIKNVLKGSLVVDLECFTTKHVKRCVREYNSGNFKRHFLEALQKIEVRVDDFKVILEVEETLKLNEDLRLSISKKITDESTHTGISNQEYQILQTLKYIEEETLPPDVLHYKMARYKVSFAGMYGVGKTSLFKRMFNEGFSEKKTFSTDKRTLKQIFKEDETVIELEIWDTADMERHGSLTLSHYRGSHFVLLVYSVNSEYSLHRLIQTASDAKRCEPAAKLILVRNKIDLPVEDEYITPEKEQTFMSENFGNKLLANFWTSAENNEGIDTILRELGRFSLKRLKSRRMSEDYQNRRTFAELSMEAKKREDEGIRCCN